MSEVAVELRRVVKPDGHVFINMGYTNKALWVAMDVAQRFRAEFNKWKVLRWLRYITVQRWRSAARGGCPCPAAEQWGAEPSSVSCTSCASVRSTPDPLMTSTSAYLTLRSGGDGR
jgi:hypothetical protein